MTGDLELLLAHPPFGDLGPEALSELGAAIVPCRSRMETSFSKRAGDRPMPCMWFEMDRSNSSVTSRFLTLSDPESPSGFRHC